MRKIAFCIIAALFFACSHQASDSEILVFKALDESLVNSTKTIERSNELIYASLEDRVATNYTSAQGKLWLPKAMLIGKYSDDINTYIESIKTQLKKDAGLFNKKNKIDELQLRLNQYKTDVLNIYPAIDSAFRAILLPGKISAGSDESHQPDISNAFFDDTPVAAALAILSRLQNYIRIIENRLVAFCNGNSTSHILICTFPTAIITQSSTYVRGGENIQINAGIEWFNSQRNTEILINQKKMHVNERGITTYEIKAPNTPGKYNVPVQVSYTDQDGKEQTFKRIINYTVADETLRHE